MALIDIYRNYRNDNFIHDQLFPIIDCEDLTENFKSLVYSENIQNEVEPEEQVSNLAFHIAQTRERLVKNHVCAWSNKKKWNGIQGIKDAKEEIFATHVLFNYTTFSDLCQNDLDSFGLVVLAGEAIFNFEVDVGYDWDHVWGSQEFAFVFNKDQIGHLDRSVNLTEFEEGYYRANEKICLQTNTEHGLLLV